MKWHCGGLVSGHLCFPPTFIPQVLCYYLQSRAGTVGAFGIPNNGPLSPHCYKNEPYFKTEGGYRSPSPELSTGEDWNSTLDACDRSQSRITSVPLRRAPPVPINETFGGPQKLSGRCGEEKNVWPWTLCPDVQRYDENLTSHPHLVRRLKMRGAVPTSSYILPTCL
jgi:hypothetical protein